MKTLSEILRREIVWVNPAHRISSALLLMRGHNLGGLPVLDGPKLAGMLTYRNVLGCDPARAVASVMDSEPTALSCIISLREAAEIMVRENAEFLPVLDAQNALLGVVTGGDLLAELRRPSDPLTDLPWSDTLREWAADKLEKGHEITILFYDVNDFGTFNKQYGHVVGDRVLRDIADVMREQRRPETDSLCRYGGDEFCIATLRRADEAESLAERIQADCAALRVPELRDQPISVTYGLRGGRRTREREQIHYASTLNNLINLASRDCMARKAQKAERNEAPFLFEPEFPGEAAVQAAEGRFGSQNGMLTPALLAQRDIRIGKLETRETGSLTLARVELQASPIALETPIPPSGGQRPLSEASVPLTSHSVRVERAAPLGELRRMIAEAALGALRNVLPEGYALQLDEVVIHPTADNRSLVTVVGTMQTPEERAVIVETVFAGDDVNHAVAEAALAAALRQMRQNGVLQS